MTRWTTAALLGALIYIVWLRRALDAARLRGDMYRDIAASLDRQRMNVDA
jgi:hypothetical protein